jgi:hypothetical protein
MADDDRGNCGEVSERRVGRGERLEGLVAYPIRMTRILRGREDGHTGEVGTSRSRTRRSRLTAIAEEYTDEIHDPCAAQQLAGLEPTLRFAAVTSPGPSDSEEAWAGNLIVADSVEALAELLREECGEGWLAHGRVWDLDASWHPWGNLSVAYSVRIDCKAEAEDKSLASSPRLKEIAGTRRSTLDT